MHEISLKKLAMRWKSEGQSYAQIAKKLGISRYAAVNLCVYRIKINKLKSGPKPKICKISKLRIKRQISIFQSNGEKVNAPKLIQECQLKVSPCTVQRYLTRIDMKYKRKPMRITLTAAHKQKRVQCIKSWITANHNWTTTIFSDEKRFSLDGPDDWRSYLPNSNQNYRMKRQCKGGGLLVWMMTMPNGLLSFKVIRGNLNSDGYINLLSENAVPIIKLNYGVNWCLQKDNSPVHKSRKVKDFIKKSGFSVLQWPARSPDLNIVEDCWKTISDLVYDGNQFRSFDELVKKITSVIYYLNQSERNKVKDLYWSIGSRLCTVLEKHGNLYNR